MGCPAARVTAPASAPAACYSLVSFRNRKEKGKGHFMGKDEEKGVDFEQDAVAAERPEELAAGL